MEIKMNATRAAVLEVLKTATNAMTLAEISAAAGMEIKTGTTNAMVKAGLMLVTGEREIVCPACGHKHKVKEYALGDLTALEKAEK